MSTYKYIYWRDDIERDRGAKTMFANVHILVGYNDRSISAYRKMLADLQKDFPEANEENTRCSVVTKSSYCEGFSLLAYDAVILKRHYKDYSVQKTSEYFYT